MCVESRQLYYSEVSGMFNIYMEVAVLFTLYVRNFNLIIKLASSSANPLAVIELSPELAPECFSSNKLLSFEISAAFSLFTLNKFTSRKKPARFINKTIVIRQFYNTHINEIDLTEFWTTEIKNNYYHLLDKDRFTIFRRHKMLWFQIEKKNPVYAGRRKTIYEFYTSYIRRCHDTCLCTAATIQGFACMSPSYSNCAHRRSAE